MLAFKSSFSNYCCSGELIVPCSPWHPAAILQLLSFNSKGEKEPSPPISPPFQPGRVGRAASVENEKLDVSLKSTDDVKTNDQHYN